jgi:mannose-1-phosphate guanylyltransferase
MSAQAGTWAIVLAAGDGTRLSSLTTDERGDIVPKQFCSLNGGPTLLQEALQRARRIVPREQVCALVARKHEPLWRHLLWSLPSTNVIVQPRNCGTGNGVLLCLLRILERDSLARILFLPADHYVRKEPILAETVRSAAMLLTRDRDSVTLVGIRPDAPDPDVGYIVPGERIDDHTCRVTQFVEKPSATAAHELIALGAVWNSFIFGAYGQTLLALARNHMPEIVRDMSAALARQQPHHDPTRALDALYEHLPVIDFSRAIVQGAERVLRVRTASPCGWADLGTPQRVAQTVQSLRRTPSARPRMPARPFPVSLNLAKNVERLLAAN